VRLRLLPGVVHDPVCHFHPPTRAGLAPKVVAPLALLRHANSLLEAILTR